MKRCNNANEGSDGSELEECGNGASNNKSNNNNNSTSNISPVFIGNSMKRMKISTSPGELRLNKDMENMVVVNGWTPFVCGHRLASPNQRAELNRDPVDTLRCSLVVMLLPEDLIIANSGTTMAMEVPRYAEKWTFLLQFPRMYPHFPPKIYRITTDLLQTTDGALLDTFTSDTSEQFLQDSNNYNNYNKAIHNRDQPQDRTDDNTNNRTYLQKKQPRCIGGVPSLQKIVVSSTPNHRHYKTNNHHRPPLHTLDNIPKHDNNNNNNSNNNIAWEDGLATVLYPNWSPISTLVDIVTFLMDLPIQRRRTWCLQKKQPPHHQQQKPIMTRNVSMNQDDILILHNKMSEDSHSDSLENHPGIHAICNDCIYPKTDHNDYHDVSIQKETSSNNVFAPAGKKHAFGFHPNRFRIGYCSHFENQVENNDNMMVE